MIETAMPEQPQESSSPIRIPSNAERPGPPNSSGMWMFISPSSCAFAKHVFRMGRVLVVVGGAGPDLLLGELVGERAQVALLVRQLK